MLANARVVNRELFRFYRRELAPKGRKCQIRTMIIRFRYQNIYILFSVVLALCLTVIAYYALPNANPVLVNNLANIIYSNSQCIVRLELYVKLFRYKTLQIAAYPFHLYGERSTWFYLHTALCVFNYCV